MLDVAILWIAGKRPAGAVGDVAEVAEEGRFVPFFDVGMGAALGANPGDEIGQVDFVAGGAGAFRDCFVHQVVDRITAAVDDHRPALAVERDAE